MVASDYLVDPGTHSVVAKSGDQEQSLDVTVAEREVREVELVFKAGAQPLLPGPAPTPAGPQEDGRGSALPVFGWMSIGIGGAALVAGAVMGGLLIGRKKALEERCGADLDDCPPAAADPAFDEDFDKYNDLRTPTGAILIAGGALVGLGVILLVVDATSDSSTALYLSPTGGGLRGRC